MTTDNELSPDQKGIAEALAAGKAVAFWLDGAGGEKEPGFMMRLYGEGFQVRDGKRRTVGSFATFDAAWAAGMAAARAA